jgi:hypothetical protein
VNLQDRGKLNRVIEDATEETSKANPDKEEVANIVIGASFCRGFRASGLDFHHKARICYVLVMSWI